MRLFILCTHFCICLPLGGGPRSGGRSPRNSKIIQFPKSTNSPSVSHTLDSSLPEGAVCEIRFFHCYSIGNMRPAFLLYIFPKLWYNEKNFL